VRILIADDDPSTLKVLSDALSLQPGCEIETATCGLEALCRVLIGDIDLLIADWRVSGMDGLELCRNIRDSELGRYVYIVLMTGRGAEDSVMEGLTVGADEFLSKPVDPSELMARVWSIRHMKRTHDELQLKNRELQETQTFRNDWSGLVVNAIRSPVSTVLGFAELAVSKASPRMKPHVEKLSREVRWIDTMLKQMLVVARSGDGRLMPSRSRMDLLALVTTTCESASALAASKSVRLALFCPEGEFQADVDGPLLQGALDNLLANAIRHSPADSTVVVELRQKGDDIVLAVIDQGPGVPPEDRKAIFEPFSRSMQDTPPKAKPFLGLAYCHAVAVAHDGEISCAENRPTGARFEIRIPVASESESAEVFDPATFATTLANDAIMSLVAKREGREYMDIEEAIEARLVLVPGPDASMPS
jgi:signal transduction histidine kinase